MELAFNVSNLAWKSCHRNCLLWRSGPKWLDPESSNLLGSRLLRVREGNSLLVHALSHFFVFSLSFFLFLSLFSLLFFPCYFLTCFLFSLLFRSCFFLPLLPCTAKAFLYYLPWWVLLFYPLTTFGLVWVSFPDHPLICWLLNQHHYPALATPCLNSRQKEFLFYFLAFCGIPLRIRIGHSLLLILMSCAWWFQFIFPPFGWYVIPARHFPKEFKQESQNRLFPSSHH